MNEHTKDRRDATCERLPYVRPALREFGPVGKLTQSGTSGMGEINSMSPNKAML